MFVWLQLTSVILDKRLFLGFLLLLLMSEQEWFLKNYQIGKITQGCIMQMVHQSLMVLQQNLGHTMPGYNLP